LPARPSAAQACRPSKYIFWFTGWMRKGSLGSTTFQPVSPTLMGMAFRPRLSSAARTSLYWRRASAMLALAMACARPAAGVLSCRQSYRLGWKKVSSCG
jgi:hypothetical protein